MKKYYITTYGCQANKSDSEKIAWKLKNSGYKKSENIKNADLIIINACSVRQSAIDRVFAKIKKSKDKKIILAGCVLPEDRKRLKNEVSEIWHPDEYFDFLPIYSGKLSALVPITKGCNNFCSYCAVPYTRGKEYSRPAKEIINEIKNLIAKEYKEIWLLGQNVNSYKDGGIKFPQLLKTINSIPGIFWIRYMSPHPKDVNNEFIKTLADCEKIPEYINLPVQSGDNEILKKMNRHYTRENYINLVKKIRKKIPNISISTDTIVGFPSETKKQFLNTFNLYKKIGFDMAFIAKYSPRPGTFSALTMKDNVPAREKEKRRLILDRIMKESAFRNNKKTIGKIEEVLLDSEKNGKFFGRTRGNKAIEINGENLHIGDFIKARITQANPMNLKGEIEKPKIIAVIGPTASGKSDLAVEIAKKINGEIISADSRQVYKGMDIGTGKITKKEMKGIGHYLLDVTDPKKVFTVVDYKNLAQKNIDEILKKSKVPIICGGTGFYIHTLLNNIEIPKVPPNQNLREQLERKNTQELFKILKKIDPERAKNIDPKNSRRIIRSIEIVKKLGKVPLVKREEKYDVLWIGIKRESKKLKKLIEKRLIKRLKMGMIKEIKNLKKRGVSSKRLEDFGLEYRFINRYLENKISKEEMVKQLNNAIIKFAKRQVTWFKKYTPEAKWVKNKNEALSLAKNFLS